MNGSEPTGVVIPVLGPVYDAKFLDPMTLVPNAAASPPSLLLYPGLEAPGTPEPLTETAAGSNVFFGLTPALGSATLNLTLPIPANNPLVRDVIVGTLTSSGLSIESDETRFVETTPSSGTFRTIAYRLPSQTILEIIVERPPSPGMVDQLKVEVGTQRDEDATILWETTADSSLFTGSLPVLGQTQILVESIATTDEEGRRMTAFVTSDTLGLSDFYLRLGPRPIPPQPIGAPPTTEERFGMTVAGVYGTEVMTPSTPELTLGPITSNPSSGPGSVEPIWLVAKGLKTMKPADRLEIAGASLELTQAAAPPGSAGSAMPSRTVRAKDPIVFTGGDPAGPSPAANVTPALVAKAERQPDGSLKATPKKFAMRLTSGFGFQTSALASSTIVVAPGATVSVTISYWRPTWAPEITAVSFVDPQGLTASPVVTTRRTESSTDRLYDVTFTVTAAANATPGARALRFQLSRGPASTYKNAFKVARGRLVIFAVDGLSFEQFQNTRNDANTAWADLFGNEALDREAAKIVPHTTSFPPITFSRWATIFSGAPPKDTRAAALQWFNRQAEVEPSEGHGDASQCLGCSDAVVGLNVMNSAGAYNRHFKVPFVYDDLAAIGMKSIVVWQQAGAGQGTGDVKNEWLRPRWRSYMHVGIEGVRNLIPGRDNDLFESDAMDRDATEITEQRLTESGQFDLLVVYLPGLDHYLHLSGRNAVTNNDARGQGEHYIVNRLHDFVGRIKTAVEKSGEAPTVYGVLSDHGHVQTDPLKFMNLYNHGSFLSSLGLKTWSSTLALNRVYHRPSVTPDIVTTDKGYYYAPNIVFTPQFGLANIYVAQSAAMGTSIGATTRTVWDRAPDIAVLDPIVKSIHANYVRLWGSLLRPMSGRPVADILVRVPGAERGFVGSSYKVVPRQLDHSRPLEEQLLELGELEGKGIGDEGSFEGPENAKWLYAEPEKRLTDYISANTGDILVLANMRDGFQFGNGYMGNHGSLTFADANVPIAFAYPGYTDDKDSTFGPLIKYLGSGPLVTEAEAMRVFLIRPRP